MRRPRFLVPCVAVLALAAVAQAQVQTYVFELDPQKSQVTFTLGSTLHTVHGSFQLKSGSIRFDAAGGTASGLLVADATSGESGNQGRDHKMHKEILESDKYPEITFAPQHIAGQVPQEGKAQVTIAGVLTLHGVPHEISIPVPVEVHGGHAVADLNFTVPYVQWGLKNPSTFMLRVNDRVAIEVHAVGRIAPSARGDQR